MKTLCLFLCACVCFTAPILAAEKATDLETQTKTVLKLCDDWDNAYIKKDAAPLDRIIHPDYIGIDEDGSVTTKAEEIALIKTAEYVIHSVAYIEPPKVRFYGANAIVTTHAKVKQTFKGQTSILTGRATIVCVNQNGTWQVASWHASKVKE